VFASRVVLSFLAGCLISVSVFAADVPGETGDDIDYTVMITKLAVLVDQADRCGEFLNNFGKKALKSPPCEEFHKGFYKEWAGRDELRAILAAEFEAVEQGKRACDEACSAQLQRIEELRVTLTYYLDYMDFVVEMEQME
jgi:hypothetical protein